MPKERLFGTDGVRGIVNQWLTPENALRLGLAIGSYFNQGAKILVGNDSRAGNAFILNAVVSALVSTGIRVFYAGPVPTPALQLYVKNHDFDAGIMITASHNPPEYSGIKVILSDGVEAPREVEEAIEETYHELRFRRVHWSLLGYDVKRVDDVNTFYVESIINHLDIDSISKKNLKVVVDGANNVGSLTTPQLLRRLGVKVLTVNCDLSHMPYREPEPTPDSLNELSLIVRSVGADLGIAHDGDADRAVFIDEKGNVLLGDRVGVLLCEYVLINKGLNIPKKVVTAISSSTIVEEVLSKYGVNVIWTKVGSINIARTMMKEGAFLGFEENGGFIYGLHQYVRDGGMTAGLMVEYLAKSGLRLSELYNRLPSMYTIKTKVSIDRGDRGKIVEIVKHKLTEMFHSDLIMDIDGIKVINPDYWILVRPSGTEPLIRIFIEARNKELANRLLSTVINIIHGAS